MEVIEIKTDNIDVAAEEIIGFLKERSEYVTYVNGWGGLGASAILKAVAKRLRSSLLTKVPATRMVTSLDKIIHIDCSLWQSKRDLQKLIAKELKLGPHVMAIFDKFDEEDDFDGVDPGARDVILDVKKEIFEHLKDTRFLVVFHNGSNSYIDLLECGLPILDFMSNRVLWTSRGRFQLHGIQDDDVKKLAGLSKVAIDLLASDSMLASLGHLIHAEAEEVATYTSIPQPYMSPKIVMECILYATLRDGNNSIDWATHAPNYWVCDGIIQAAGDNDKSAWDISGTLHKNMHTDDWHHVWLVNIRDALGLFGEQWRRNDRWILATHESLQELKQDEEHKHEKAAIVQVPPHATSFFLIGASSFGMNNKAATKLEDGLFGNSKSLRVLHLSYCTFSFSSPPFLSCSNLRFLLVDHCIEDKTNHDGKEDLIINCIHNDGSCFEKLWVLEVNYTYWYCLLSEKMMDLMANLKELNINGVKNWSIRHLCPPSCGSKSNRCRLLNLHKLQVTIEPIDISSEENEESPVVASLDMSCSTTLNTIVLDNCVELKHISLKGCTQLQSLWLRGLFEGLEELDMSGTTMETLDLSSMQSLRLKRLFLLGCDKLRAILWPQEDNSKQILQVLRIDTITTNAAIMAAEGNATMETTDVSSVQSVLPTEHCSGRAHNDKDSYFFLKDARLLRSLQHITFDEYLNVEISSASIVPTGHEFVNEEAISSSVGSSNQQVRVASMQKPTSKLYADSVVGIFEDNSQAPCPSIMGSYTHCNITIQDETQGQLMRGTSSATLPEFVHDWAKILHLHDSLSLTSIPGPGLASINLTWKYLLHCKLERCPNLDGPVFNPPLEDSPKYLFYFLRTFWASQLQKSHCIWDWMTSFRPPSRAFEDLKFLHLDSCPRIKHVLPLYTSNIYGCYQLEILEIMQCDGLTEVFPLDSNSEKKEARRFPYLKHIHLHELPMLQHICGHRMSAPKLETIKIRGCWSLRRLPAVGNTQPSVDCEKEWWDNLKWDGVKVGHHPSLYKPSHAKYYKKTLLRNTVLR